VLSETSEHLVPIHNRHISIQQYNVRPFALYFFQAFFSVGGGNDLTVAPFKATLNSADQIRLIINDKYLGSIGFLF